MLFNSNQLLSISRLSTKAVKSAVNLAEEHLSDERAKHASASIESKWDKIAITQAIHLLRQLTPAFN